MIERVANTIARYAMFQPGQKAGVAVSGGADSVCLLHLLRELATRWDLRLGVLHLNHRLRGRESEEDAGFVRELAAEFGLPFLYEEAHLDSTGDNLEQAARAARLEFFAEAIQAGHVDRIALGHTRSDQAETVLFRFLRGAGTAGLAGIRPVTSTGLVRPLLSVDRAEVESFLRERKIRWREDSTNADFRFARNRIRHELLPAIARDWNPAMPHLLAQTADWALAEEQYWDGEMDRLAAAHFIRQDETVLLSTGALKALPQAAGRRLLRHAMKLVRGNLRSIEFAHVLGVMEMAQSAEGHGRLMAPELDVMRSFDWLRFAKPGREGLAGRNYRCPAVVPGVVRAPAAGVAISLEVTERQQGSEPYDWVYNGMMVSVDWERLSGSLSLRNWRPGDQYQRLGSSSEEKIKTLFQDFRVPLWERRHWPVLTEGETIVWARRFGPAARFAAGPATRKILWIREIGIAPEGSASNATETGREVS